MADIVNPQITDAVTQANLKVVGEAPAQAMGVVYQVMATSVGNSMQNASSTQHAMQQISIAVVATATAKIIKLAP